MNLKDELDKAIRNWQLLSHPFYQSWSNGTLPISTLRTYEREYGAFIEELPLAWECLDDFKTAEEEREHFLLWEDFAHSLGTHAGCAMIPEVEELIEQARELYSDRVTAIGGLYAFEVQQPLTAQSKLEGLQKHYHISKAGEKYFLIHASNEEEVTKIINLAEFLKQIEAKRCVRAA